MKTNLISMTAILLALSTACIKDMVPEGGKQPISFSGFNVTKSLVAGETDMRAAGLKLYGFQSGDVIFDARSLTWSTDKWVYSGQTEWWVPGNNYDFLGIYPNSVAASRSDKVITFDHSVADYHYQQQTDLLSGYHNRSYAKNGDASVVALPMKHLLSQITIKVVNASDTGTLDVTGASITGLYASGTCRLTIAGGTCTTVWTPTGDRVTATSKYAGDKNVTALAIGEEHVADLYQEPLLVIPQAVNSDDIKLNLTVTPSGSTPYSKSVSFRAATGITSWEPGKKYTYIASITSNIITFSVSVNDWIEDEEHEIR